MNQPGAVCVVGTVSGHELLQLVTKIKLFERFSWIHLLKVLSEPNLVWKTGSLPPQTTAEAGGVCAPSLGHRFAECSNRVRADFPMAAQGTRSRNCVRK